MPSTVKRRFTLIDAVALLAATAIGLALLRPALIPLDAELKALHSAGLTGLYVSSLQVRVYVTPVLVAWSVASLALSLRQPRRLSHSLGRSPGFVINTVVIAGVPSFIIIRSINTTLHLLRGSNVTYMQVLREFAGKVLRRSNETYMHELRFLAGSVGYFVIGSLVALALFRRLRPRPIWTDRLGWTLGWVWVGMAILTWSSEP